MKEVRYLSGSAASPAASRRASALAMTEQRRSRFANSAQRVPPVPTTHVAPARLRQQGRSPMLGDVHLLTTARGKLRRDRRCIHDVLATGDLACVDSGRARAAELGRLPPSPDLKHFLGNGSSLRVWRNKTQTSGSSASDARLFLQLGKMRFLRCKAALPATSAGTPTGSLAAAQVRSTIYRAIR